MIQKPKGTYDVVNGKDVLFIRNLLEEIMDKYNYEYFRTPLFESSDLFHRTVGETSDIVTKETYDFKDRGDRLMTLRPEGTAGIVRSFIENKLYGNHPMPLKCWYFGPMYRYERPQSGRFREFYQFGVEVFGSDSTLLDAEVISIPVTFYQMLGLNDVKVKINSLGDSESREVYTKALKDYFKPYLDELCDDCKRRYEQNPLRLLDCKVDNGKEIFKNAPKMIDYLNEESKKRFEQVQKCLNNLEINYEVDSSIVRGLDYYNHTVFEVTASIEGFGSQNVLCGGGRYDHLVENLGGPKTNAVGFALGLERLFNALELSDVKLPINDGVDIYIASMDQSDAALKLCYDLRLNGFKVDMDYDNKNLKSSFKQADRMNAHFVIIIGSEEVKDGYVTVKNNHTKEENKIDLPYLVMYLDEQLGSCDCEECDHE